MLGGGRAGFLPKNIREPGKGNRLDGKNLIQTWKDANPNGVYVTTDKQLSEVDFDCTDKLFGLYSHLLVSIIYQRFGINCYIKLRLTNPLTRRIG